jgi:hypothetical protein
LHAPIFHCQRDVAEKSLYFQGEMADFLACGSSIPAAPGRWQQVGTGGDTRSIDIGYEH